MEHSGPNEGNGTINARRSLSALVGEAARAHRRHANNHCDSSDYCRAEPFRMCDEKATAGRAHAATCCSAPAHARARLAPLPSLSALTATAHLSTLSRAILGDDVADECLLGSRKLAGSSVSSSRKSCSSNSKREPTRQQPLATIQGWQQSSQQRQKATISITNKPKRAFPSGLFFRFKRPQSGVSLSSLLALSLFALVLALNLAPPFQCKSVSRESSPTSVQQTSNEITKNPQKKLEVLEEPTTPRASETPDSALVVELITTPLPQLNPTVAVTAAAAAAAATTTTTTTGSTNNNESEEDDEQDDTAAATKRDTDDVEDCQSLPADDAAEAKNLTDNEKLVNLQTCFQGKVKRNIMKATRSGLDMFDRLSLTGGCTASLMSLMSNLAELKSFAFKFVDASAKIPSGVMLGLLSDYGDFDECLSIRSNPSIEPEDEVEERAYSGKYCLLSVHMDYHVKLGPNETVPKGIIEDGIFWDELVRRYWTSKSTKGFQLGVCFPSRCTNDDLEQIYKQVARGSSFSGQVISCQTSLELKQQYKPDLIQRLIVYMIFALIALAAVGTLIDRYWPHLAVSSSYRNCSSPSLSNVENSSQSGTITTTVENDRRETIASIAAPFFRILICFSVMKNWKIFIGKEQQLESSQQWDCFTNSTISPTSLASNSVTITAISREPSFRIDPPVATTQNVDLSNMRMIPSSLKHHQQKVALGTGNSNNEDSKDEKLYPLAGNFQSPSPPTRSSSPTTTARLYLRREQDGPAINLSHLSGLKLLVILWITLGHSFLYPSAHNYQYYRSIISMKLTRDSVWFAITNFTLGIDMILYMAGLVFVYKVAYLNSNYLDQMGESNQKSLGNSPSDGGKIKGGGMSPALLKLRLSIGGVARVISKKILRLWPTYLSLIALAILMPMLNDGPLWPEMVTKRLGESCRKNWWSNLLFINNFGLGEPEICLPSSWFISVLMQLFLIGSIIIALVHLISLEFALTILLFLLFSACAGSFAYAYLLNLRAPVILLDETFVMELDANIFRLYTSTINNFGPFLIGMIGGFFLICAQVKQENSRNQLQNDTKSVASSPTTSLASRLNELAKKSFQALITFSVLLIALAVLSSVFVQEYSRFWASTYWALHRVGWAIATGYLIHNCATGRWLLLKDLLSLSTFTPLSKLVFIAYLVNPIYIYVHSGLVRDGLHVSTYNMLSIYITRLVMTFMTALFIHLLVELPFNSIEEIYFNDWIGGNFRLLPKAHSFNKSQPLLATVSLGSNSTNRSAQEMTSSDGKTKDEQELQQL